MAEVGEIYNVIWAGFKKTYRLLIFHLRWPCPFRQALIDYFKGFFLSASACLIQDHSLLTVVPENHLSSGQFNPEFFGSPDDGGAFSLDQFD
jgi:hypothetical protein